MPSSLEQQATMHVAIIMDGNGRWATGRGLPRTAGHRAGVEAARRAVDAAPGLGIRTLTLFAFSSDNWRRPAAEVAALMALARDYLERETRRLVEAGVTLEVIGRRDRLPPGLSGAVAEAERETQGGTALRLRLAIDYSSRHAIAVAAAASAARAGRPSPDQIADCLGAADVDLLVRTGGEKRLSDFLLWECAYAELVFTDVAWPAFGASDLAEAVAEFRKRDRRFGAAPPAPPPPNATALLATPVALVS